MVAVNTDEAIRSESLADQVYSFLRAKIAEGGFRPGERVLEKKIAGQLEISRTPIREALLRLERDGLVVCTSRRSYNIRLLTVEDVIEIYETLGILEGVVACAVSGKITGEAIEQLELCNREMDEAARKGALPAFGQLNRKFHAVFLDRYENRTIREICDSVRGRLYTFPVRKDSLPEWLQKSVAEHNEIIRLVAAGDGEALGNYFREVHWSWRKNLPFIKDAFDREGSAAVHL